MKKKILVVMGGTSKEREISKKSGYACIKALKELGCKVKIFDPKKKKLNKIKKYKNHIIFNALHGKGGEDGIAQSYFEFFNIPYTHSGIISSINAMDKLISKKIFLNNKILTPKYFDISQNQYNDIFLSQFIKKKNFKFPIVAKPINEGSSIGVKIIKNFKVLKFEVKNLLKKYQHIIIEEFIPGQEIQVAVLNDKALGAIELKPKRKFYDYKAKYNKSAQTQHIMPADIGKKSYLEVCKIAERVHKIMKCRGVTRSDFKFHNGKFFILELNTQPGMTNLSLVPEIARYKKISFKKLVKNIVLDADVNK